MPELVPSLPVEETKDTEQMAPSYEDYTKDSLTEQSEPPVVDICNSSLAEIDLFPKHITPDHGHGVDCESTHFERSKQKSQLSPGPLQNEIMETSSAASKCATVEQLVSPPEALTDSSLIEITQVPVEDVASLEKSASLSEDKTKESLTEQLELPPIDASNSNLAETCLCHEQIISEERHELGSGCVHNKPSEQKSMAVSEPEPLESETLETCHVSGCTGVEQPKPPAGVCPEDVTKTPSPERLAQPSENFEDLETSPKDTIDCYSPSRSQEKEGPKVLKKKHRKKHLVDSDRVLRPRSQEKPKPMESITDMVNDSSEEKGGKKKRKERMRNVTSDEFLRIRQRLRYFQSKINYERSLIDAYSGEGWKGLSLEKLKPEKELQRAKSEIVRQKLRIRDLFQHLVSLCAEGRIPESLFDSEGEIESEDIFCAKCGSKDVSLDNDIILCDGACERAFHQFCLEPPLRKEEIPPDDEGWLCPGCDCKLYCIDILNESQGTNLSVTDSWEKVFPEAAASARQNQDPNFGLPSDDSEDDDYDPDVTEIDDKAQEDDASSDESRSGIDEKDQENGSCSDELGDQYTTASDDLGKLKNEEQFLGLPSDDSEDDDYNPSALNHDDKVKHESSSSDFTSDSEDLGAAMNDGMSHRKDEDITCSSLRSIKSRRGSDGRSSNAGRKKQQFIKEELSSLLESDRGEGVAPVFGKRHVERLDYKKLHDEEYGNVSTDSSDDEIWTAKETHDNASSESNDDDRTNTVTQRKRKKMTGKVMPVLLDGGAPVLKDETNAKDIKHDPIEPKHTSRKRTRQKMNSENTSGSPSTPDDKDPSISGYSNKKARSSNKKAAIQELHRAFKENQYPDRPMKESLAARLELTLQQVSKWFENTRWSARHSACVEPCSTACTARYSRRKTPLTGKGDKPPEPGPETVPRNATSNINNENNKIPEAPEPFGGGNMASPGSSSKGSRKRKGKGKLASVEETPALPADLPNPRDGRIQTRSRKSTG